jgi:hypothetical protein
MAPRSTAQALRACMTDPVAFAYECTLAGEAAQDAASREAMLNDGVAELARGAAYALFVPRPRRLTRLAQVCVWMCAHRRTAAVQTAGCRALRALGPEPYGAVSLGRAKTAAAGGLQAIVAGMRVHAEVAVVAEAACGAMWYLARTPAVAGGPAGAAALDAVVAALRVHATQAAVNECGCGALRNLFMLDSLKPLAASSGALEAVIAALRVHTRHRGVQEQAAGALVNIAASRSNAALAVEGGAVEVVVATLASAINRPAVLLPACVALFNLTYASPDASRLARGAGAASVLRELLALYQPGGTHRASEADALVLREAVLRVLHKVEAPEPSREERGVAPPRSSGHER